jgi:hypothetical protein
MTRLWSHRTLGVKTQVESKGNAFQLTVVHDKLESSSIAIQEKVTGRIGKGHLLMDYSCIIFNYLIIFSCQNNLGSEQILPSDPVVKEYTTCAHKHTYAIAKKPLRNCKVYSSILKNLCNENNNQIPYRILKTSVKTGDYLKL